MVIRHEWGVSHANAKISLAHTYVFAVSANLKWSLIHYGHLGMSSGPKCKNKVIGGKKHPMEDTILMELMQHERSGRSGGMELGVFGEGGGKCGGRGWGWSARGGA